MNAKLLHVPCSIRWSFLAAAGCCLPYGATALPTAYAPEWGTVILNAENHSGDAVSVKAKRASLSAFNGVVVPALGANPSGTSDGRIVYVYAGGYTGDFISIGGGGGGGGFTPTMGGYGGGLPMISAVTAPALGLGSGLVTLNPVGISTAVGSSPAGISLPAVSSVAIPGVAGAQPSGNSSAPVSLVTPLTDPAGNAGGMSVLPVLPAVVSSGVAPADNPATLATNPTGVPGTTTPSAASTSTVGGAVVVSVPAAAGTMAGGAVVVSAPVPAGAGTVAPGVSPFATPVLGTFATVPSAAIVVPDSGSALLLLGFGLATLLAGRGRFAPLH